MRFWTTKHKGHLVGGGRGRRQEKLICFQMGHSEEKGPAPYLCKDVMVWTQQERTSQACGAPGEAGEP